MHISDISDQFVRDGIRRATIDPDKVFAWEISFSGIPQPDGQGGLGFQPIAFLVMTLPAPEIGSPHLMRFAPCDPVIVTHAPTFSQVAFDMATQLLVEYEERMGRDPKVVLAAAAPSGLILPGR